MRLLRARTVGIAGVPDGAWDFAQPDTGEPLDLVLFTGPSAIGQTRLLEAIGAARERLAPSGLDVDDARLIARGYPAAKVELRWWFDEEERELTRHRDPIVETEVVFGREPEIDRDLELLLASYDHAREAPKLEYFPSRRAVDPMAKLGLEARAHEKLRASKDPRKYAFIPRYLRHVAERGEHRRFTELLAAFTDTCRFDPDTAGFVSARGDPCSLFELSSSETDAVIFAATAALIGLDRSLVLVDRPDIFLGDDPARLVSALRGLGEGAQILAASGSPRLLRAVPRAHVIEIAP